MDTKLMQQEKLLKKLQLQAEPYGLVLRGGFTVIAEDQVPSLSPLRPTVSLVLFGNAGSSIWPAFSRSPEYLDGKLDPLDRWSRRIGESMAKQFDGLALYPFDGPPFHSFLTWAEKGEPTTTSPLLIKIHPKYGLWHAYRFALALAEPLYNLAPPKITVAPCDNCITQPCLQECPVGAFTDHRYLSDRCVRYLIEEADSECLYRGCLARLACPEGQSFRYRPEHARFHMRAFVESQQRKK
ncbi:MAG: hypothetical protein ABW148_11570 [Sedimenticola sp.]